jgi:hypothetical protein
MENKYATAQNEQVLLLKKWEVPQIAKNRYTGK